MVKYKFSLNPLNKPQGATLLHVTWNKGYSIILVVRDTIEAMADSFTGLFIQADSYISKSSHPLWPLL